MLSVGIEVDLVGALVELDSHVNVHVAFHPLFFLPHLVHELLELLCFADPTSLVCELGLDGLESFDTILEILFVLTLSF